MNVRQLTVALNLDGLANIVSGFVLLAAGGWLAGHFGLAGGWPLRLVGALLVVYGIENHFVARRPSPATLTGLAVVDVGFAAAALTLAVTNPTTAASWVLWALAAAGIGSLVFGLVKLAGRETVGVPHAAPKVS